MKMLYEAQEHHKKIGRTTFSREVKKKKNVHN